MGKYKAYEEYKDSGSKCLSKLPTHWEFSKLRYMFKLGKGLTITKENLVDEGVPCVNYGEIHSKYGFEVDPEVHPLKCVSEEYLNSSASSLLFKGDLVFADTSEDIAGSGNFTQLICDHEVFAGYHTVIVRPLDRACFRFYAYLFDSSEFRTKIRLSVKGVKVFSITQAILRGLDIWLPDVAEQIKISSFLDYETAKIDELIEKQQKLIQLLKEKRQAVISHAVTKGLNPDAPMKDSGVEWLGDVPEHWGVGKFTHYIKIRHGYQFRDYDFTSEGIKIVKITQLSKDGYLDLSNCSYIAKDRLSQFPDIVIKNEDILMCLTGGTIGKIIRVRDVHEPLLQNYRVGHFSSAKNLISDDYIFYLMSSRAVLDQIFYLLRETGQPNIGMEDFGAMKICIPSLEDQKKICSFLGKILPAFDVLEKKAISLIEKAVERRTALISAAVTGKIDVRDWQPPKQTTTQNTTRTTEEVRA